MAFKRGKADLAEGRYSIDDLKLIADDLDTAAEASGPILFALS